MKKRKPFSLYKRGEIWYVRMWDNKAGSYTPGKSTGETDRDVAAVRAAEMIKSGKATVFAHLKHLQDHGEDDYLKQALNYIKYLMEEKNVNISGVKIILEMYESE